MAVISCGEIHKVQNWRRVYKMRSLRMAWRTHLWMVPGRQCQKTRSRKKRPQQRRFWKRKSSQWRYLSEQTKGGMEIYRLVWKIHIFWVKIITQTPSQTCYNCWITTRRNGRKTKRSHQTCHKTQEREGEIQKCCFYNRQGTKLVFFRLLTKVSSMQSLVASTELKGTTRHIERSRRMTQEMESNPTGQEWKMEQEKKSSHWRGGKSTLWRDSKSE